MPPEIRLQSECSKPTAPYTEGHPPSEQTGLAPES